jgi:hypothetical protein
MPSPLPPEGEKWTDAERWDVDVSHALAPQLASGRRYVWVVTGRKWAYVRDAETHQKMPIDSWHRMSKTGRKVS